VHELTFRPELTRFIHKVPDLYRCKIFYTTNVLKRLPAAYFASLSECGLHHINISIESVDPALFERLRKGARHRIFMENWDALLDAVGRAPAPPPRYIVMACKSNLRELPHLTAQLLTFDGRAIQ